MAKVQTHRKLPDGGYRLEVEDEGQIYTFDWPGTPKGLKAVQWEKQQLAEAKLLIEDAKAQKGRKLKSEGQTL